MKKIYLEPEMNLIQLNEECVLMASGSTVPSGVGNNPLDVDIDYKW